MIRRPESPPSWARRILSRLGEYQERFAIAGDLEEVFHELGQATGYRKARRWYCRQCLRALPSYLSYTAGWGLAMLRSYLKTGLRNISRQKIQSTINILGLSLGTASCILFILYVSDEFSFDRFHSQADSLYAVVSHNQFHGTTAVAGMMGMGPLLQENSAEIRHVVRLNRRNQAIVRCRDLIFNEETIFVDPAFFEVFSFSLLQGSRGSALQAENGVVLTRRMASKYFGVDSPLGKPLSMTFGTVEKEFTVTGVAEDPPGNSTIDFDFLINIQNLREIRGPEYMSNRQWFDTQFFVLLQPGASAEAVNLRFPLFVKQHFKDTLERWKETGSWRGEGDVFSFRLHNIKSLHLNPTIRGIGSSDFRSSLILGGIALLILAIACINFINSAIGRASGRSLEIGVRKIIGARKGQLVHQFWTESLLLVFLAVGGGILLASLFLPLFNRLAHKSLQIHSFFKGVNLLAAVGMLLLVGIAAGSFPSLVMAGFRPVDILKSRIKFGRKTLLTKSLLTVQFMLAVFLITAAFTMSEQIRTMTRKHLGFRPEGVIVIPLQESGWDEGIRTDALIRRFRGRLIGRAGILNVSASTMTFSRLMVMSHIKIKGLTYDVFFNRVDFDYLETLGIPLTAGRDFSRAFSTDATSVIVNQKFVSRYEPEDPIGAVIYDAYDEATPLTIIGVVEDFHLQSLEREIEPIILHMRPEATAHNLMVRVSTEELGKTTALLERTWEELQPDKPFLFSFLDEHIQGAYEEERRWHAIVRWASILAMAITGMGVFALTALTLSRRVKEIGIRRVLGADAFQIICMVGREFLVLTVVANAVVWPVAYLVIRTWLRGFAYRTSLGPEPFIWAALLTVTVALATVSALAIRAALADPVKSLRIE